MNAAEPTTRPAHSGFQLAYSSFDVLFPRCVFLDESDPTYPFVARKRSKTFPSHECFCIRIQRYPQIRRHLMNHTAGNCFIDHKVILSNRELPSFTLLPQPENHRKPSVSCQKAWTYLFFLPFAYPSLPLP